MKPLLLACVAIITSSCTVTKNADGSETHSADPAALAVGVELIKLYAETERLKHEVEPAK